MAAGIKDIAPTAADAPVMLETGRVGFNNFADFGVEPEGRLYVSFGDASEVLYLGLSIGYNNDGEPYNSTTRGRYRFQIRKDDPSNGNPIVHGPFTVTNLNANISSYADAEYGIYSTDEISGGDSMYVFRPGDTGEYYIEFDDANVSSRQVNIPFWDFTVVRDGAVRDGRVWSRGWAFRTPLVDGTSPPDCVWDREFNGVLYSYTEDGFVSEINFENSGFQGLSFNIAFNETGPGTTGNLAEDRKSVAGSNETANARQHRIFLSLPDIEIFPDGVCGEVTAGDSFICGGVDLYCLEVEVTRQGQVEIILDFDGNGTLDDNGMDVALVYDFHPDSLTACIPWSGLLADGTPVSFSDTVDVIINYAQGVQHYSAYDVEFLKNGFCVETIRPTCNQGQLTSSRLFYDDREIPEDPGTGASKDGRDGCDCGDGCRTWTNFSLNAGGTCNSFNDNETNGYGDKSTLNTYWFASSQVEFKARVPVISANIVGPTELCEGETSSLTAMDNGIIGTPSYLWEGPGVEGSTTSSVDVSAAGTYCVTIVDPVGCSSRTCTDITVTDFDASPFPQALDICFGETITLPEGGNIDYDYIWSPNVGIDDINSNQPTFNPTETTTYTVTITNSNSVGSVCSTTEEVVINVSPDINLQVIGGGPICDATLTLTASTDVEADIVLFNPAGVQIATGNEFTLDVSGESDYLIVATGAQNCTDSIVFTVSGGPVDISVPDTVLSCLSDGVNLAVTNLDANDELSYVWSPAGLFDPSTINSANPTFIGGEGDFATSVTVTNQYGCSTTENVRVIMIDDNGELSFTTMLGCDGSTVDIVNTSTVSFGYVYDFGDGSTSTERNPSHFYSTPGTYTITLDLIYDQNCVASVTREVTTFQSLLNADLRIGLGDCGNGSATLNFTDASINATGDVLEYEWVFTGVTPTTSTDRNPTVTVSESGTITATLTATSVDDCTSDFDTTITVNLAEVNLADEILVCPGESAELNPSGDEGLNYNWSSTNGFSSSDPNPVVNVAGTYIVTVTTNSADFNCSQIDSVVILAPIIEADLTVGLADCGDGSATLNFIDATNTNVVGLGYEWTFTGVTPTTSTNQSPSVTISESGTVTATLEVTSNDGCSSTLDTTFTVNLAEVNLANEILVCPGESAELNPGANEDLIYSWSSDNGFTSNNPNPITNVAGTYVVTVTSNSADFNCSNVDSVTVLAPALEAGLAVSLEDCADGAATLSFMDASTNVVGLNYSWTFTGGVSPATSMDQNPSVTISQSGTVTARLEVTSNDGCSSAVDTTFTVSLTAVSLMDEVLICPGESAELNPGADEGLVYNWSPANGFDPTDANPVTSEAGTYIVTITSTVADFNCANNSIDTITVVVADSIGLTVNGPDGPIGDGDGGNGGGGGTVELPTLQTCGAPVDLTVDLGTEGDVDVTYTDLDGNVLGGGGSITVSPNGRDTVVITAVNEFGCTERDTVVIVNTQVNAGIDVGANGLNFCSATDTTISVTNFDPADTLTYAWGANEIIIGSLTNQTVDIVTPAEGSVDIFLTVTNQFGCDTMIMVTVTSTPFTPNQYPDVIQPCFEDGFTIEGGAAVDGYTYEWLPDGDLDLTDPANPVGTFNQDGGLSVTITDPLTGCSETQAIEVDVAPEISFMASPTDTVICDPANITVGGSSVNDDVVIVWYDDPELTNQVGTGSTYVVEASEVGQTYNVYGEATDPNTGCRQVIPVTVSVSNITAGLPLDDVNACSGEGTSIFAPGGVLGNLVYSYSPPELIDDSDPSNPVFAGNSNSTVTVTTIDPATGCSSIKEVNITFTEIGGLTGLADLDDIFLGGTSTLSVLGDCVGCTYEWTGGNGTITPNTGQTVEVMPDEAGDVTYEVAVTLNGCTVIIPITLRVQDPLCDEERIFIPNAFTPNQDTKNDVMRVRTNFADQITEFRWIIYNRWGQEVYNSTDINDSWDGTQEGDDLEPDVYGYWIRLVCPTGEPFIKQGNITILR